MLWDVNTGLRRATISGHQGLVRVVLFSPDGKTVLSGSDDATIRLWDVETGANRTTLTGHSGRVTCLAFAPDGKTLASGSWDKSIKLWDMETQAERATLRGHTNYLRGVAFSPDGTMLASSGNDSSVRLWDLAKNQQRTLLDGHIDQVPAVAFAPDGKTVASISNDQTIKLWDVATGKESATLHGHYRRGAHVTFSPDGKTLASTSQDGTVRLWDMAALNNLPARYVPPKGDAAELLAYINNLEAFRPKTYHQFREHEARSPGAAFAAAEAILKLKQVEASEAHQVSAAIVLKHRVATLADADPDQQRRTLSDVKSRLAAKAKEGLTRDDLSVAATTAAALASSGSSELAADAYTSFAELFAASKNETLAATAKTFAGAAGRCALVGKELELKGTMLDGTALDWSAYRGKVVLVDFCDTQSAEWRAELHNVRKNYQLFHDRGFDVVRVSSDSDRAVAEKFFQDEKQTWGVTLHDTGAAGKHPLAVQYGITAYPTALLVDKEGKVVSLQAHGKELDEQLTKLLGPPFAPKGKLTYIDLQPKANRRLAETWAGGPGNDLSEFPQGEQTLAGVKFKIGDGLIQLGSRVKPGVPARAAGIQVNQKTARFYILQSMEWAAHNVAEGKFVGRYEVRYEDQSTEKIYIVKGEDVRDWWSGLHPDPVSRGKLVWVGHNAATRRGNRHLRLFLCVWENPEPDKKILHLDFVSTMTTGASPFCVAITAEAAPDAAGNSR
jgi:hypothetical protein